MLSPNFQCISINSSSARCVCVSRAYKIWWSVMIPISNKNPTALKRCVTFSNVNYTFKIYSWVNMMCTWMFLAFYGDGEVASFSITFYQYGKPNLFAKSMESHKNVNVYLAGIELSCIATFWTPSNRVRKGIILLWASVLDINPNRSL